MPQYDSSIVRAAINDPANAGKNSADIAALFAPVPKYVPIDLAKLDAYLLTNSLKTPLKQLAADPQTDPTLAAGLSDFLDLVDSPRHTQLSYDDPTVRTRTNTVLGVLQQMTKLSAQQVSDIAAMGTQQSYPAGGPVAAADVDFEIRGMACDGLQGWVNRHAMQVNAAIATARTVANPLPTTTTLAGMFDPNS